jgi:hypothetical protein
VEQGEVVPVYLNNKLEAYAKLIISDGEKLTSINPEDPDFVYVGQRWLIEWAYPDDIPPNTPRELLWTQRALVGNRTHRIINYKANLTWDEYSSLYGYLQDKNYYERKNDRKLDDSSLLF